MPPLVFHQSDLAAYNWCPEQLHLKRLGRPRKQGSAAAYGSVQHHCYAVLKRERSLEKALATWEHYWHPLNIEAICPPVPADGWQGRDSYGSLRLKGIDAITSMWEQMKTDEVETLALEYDFVAPMPGTPFWIAGSIDALEARRRRRKLELHVTDYKTGQQKRGLRWNQQGTLYTLATLQREFWTGHPPVELRRFGTNQVHRYETAGFGERAEQLADRFDGVPRRFMWVNARTAKWVDGGYRDDLDFDRLRLAMTELHKLEQVDVWPLRLDGETCEWCDMRDACKGLPVPPETYGDPFA